MEIPNIYNCTQSKENAESFSLKNTLCTICFSLSGQFVTFGKVSWIYPF